MPGRKRAGPRDALGAGIPVFGPAFFLGQLRAFARERCPEPTEELPQVEVHLATGEALDLCHVIGLAPTYVGLAIREKGRPAGEMRMRTELVPYSMIVRITIRPAHEEGPQVGFNVEHAPELLGVSSARRRSPEAVLRSAAAAAPSTDINSARRSRDKAGQP